MCKKIWMFMLACLLLLAGCAEDGTPETTEMEVHTHAPSAEWDRNVEEHWQICECGEKLDAAEHSLENGNCTVCGTEIQYDDGLVELFNSDEDGFYDENCSYSRWTIYDGAGNLVADWRYDYGKAEDGNLLRRSYENGVLREEAVFGGASGNLRELTSYLDDGSWIIEVYDPTGLLAGSICFAADGTLESDECYDDEYFEDWEGYVAKRAAQYTSE